MGKYKILVVDDEPAILNLITQLLGNEEYTIETTVNGTLAWEKLSRKESAFDFVILDRMMPGINGLELLKMIKSDSRLGVLPVIMQSGATSPEQIAEGIEAGAYYYLTKPYAPTALRCIVRAVIADIELRAEVSAQAARHQESLKYFTSAELQFSTLEDVNRVAGILASLCPDPDIASSGLVELLLNAVEHGNLGITYEEKKLLMYEDRWEEELKRRLALPEYMGLMATVTFERCSSALTFRITDQGQGFDWTKYLEIDPARSLDPNGRGIAMSRRHSFSTVEFQGTGNVVKATVLL
ncbi:MAG: response regulator [Deltaproteobacteria bacterium]|jgi:DNA-binding response OmpR family regulator|nr:response regulator [Deltaproteobacteria bacterium]